MTDIKDTLRHFIAATWLPGEPPDDLRDDTPLQTSGILDSLGTLRLLSFIKDTYGVALDVYDTSIERFDRIADIATIVEEKRDGLT